MLFLMQTLKAYVNYLLHGQIITISGNLIYFMYSIVKGMLIYTIYIINTIVYRML